ncbi:MAG TPA: sugar kinase, partial [Caldithrix abyssi]|nr:sugar kinase [Caldithrix abyssi]
LKQRRVNFDGMVEAAGKTFRWGGGYHKNMNMRDTLFTDLNVFETFDPVLPDHYKSLDYLFLANIDPDLQLKVLDQMHKPRAVILDTMNFWISGKKESLTRVIQRTDILIINDEELTEYTGTDNFMEGLKLITSLGPKVVVIKRGMYGAVLYNAGRFFFAPAYPLPRVMDPTGAGDTFAGGFIGYLAEQDNLDEITLRRALVYGSTTASFTVEEFSMDRLKNIDRDTVDKRWHEFKEMMSF